MEIRTLNYFLAVAREENITNAAKSLNITQPTLSRQMQQLEIELNVKLFEKVERKMKLTNEGMILKRRAQEIVTLADKTVTEVSHRESDLDGEIAIGCGELKSTDLLSKMIVKFHQQHPKVTFDIFSGNTTNIRNRMDQGMLDIGLFLNPVDVEKYDFVRMNVDETWCVCVRNDSILANKDYIRPEDLEDQLVMLPGRENVNHELINWLGKSSENINNVVNYNLIYNDVKLVQNGMGVLICLKLDANYDNVKFIPLKDAPVLHSVLAWHSGQVFTPTITAFIEFIKNYLAEIE
ncbi:LysR family transcriptional regulator [Companilactobacillus sp. HBUAS59699]|uniref:LysR family transcriptional regulator n=1 Tax=Companilactobacillus sp. HBUAS59699 TaxID=3109358 RepID=UPI002FEF9F04